MTTASAGDQDTATVAERDIERNTALVHRYWDAVTAGDLDTLAALLHDNVVVHYPGEHFLSGDYRGKEAVLNGLFATLFRFRDYFDGRLNDAAVGEKYAVVIHSYRLPMFRGRSLPGGACGLVRFVDDKIIEYWLFEWDVAMLNDAFDAVGGPLARERKKGLARALVIPRTILARLGTARRLFGKYRGPGTMI